jgi:HSP20 family protein
MRARKQSFLERLTGTQSVATDTALGTAHADENVLSEKPWSPRVDNIMEEDEENTELEKDGTDRAPLEAEEEEDVEAGLAIDMYEEDNELIIQSMIAGVTPENLHITITRDAVTIEGERIAPEGIPEGQYVERELYWGRFSRDIELPFEIDTDGAEAVEKYGLLIIRLPRLDRTRAQELKVKSI